MSDEEYGGCWVVADMSCSVCNTTARCHYPAICVKLECPHCGHMMPAPDLPVRFDAEGRPVPEDKDLYDAIEGIQLMGGDDDGDEG